MPQRGPRPSATPGVDPSIPPEERYDIIGRIAAGGMAEIYMGRMRTPGGQPREVVLKRLMPELQSDHEFVQMFYDEAAIASQLRHPNIVHIFELGELDGSLFIAMELIRGVNLRDLLARLHRQQAPLPIPLAVRIACHALDALDYAHQFSDENGRPLNVVHRDVSPQNILVTYDGTVKLVDFGVAKAEGRLHQTRAGLIKGKFAYMSPEQVSGGRVDARSDLFALAELFYELLLRRHPFYAESDMEVLRAILDKDPPHPCSVDGNFPPALAEVLMRAMRKAPGDRFGSAGEMLNHLERFLQDSRTPAPTSMVGRFMSDLFADRIEREHRARKNGDDDALIEALTQGRSDAGVSEVSRKISQRQPSPVVIDETSSADALPKGARDRVVEITRAPSYNADPAERGAPAFLAHSGYTNSGLSRQRFQAQVRGLFDEPADDPTTTGLDTQTPDAGELPTMLGALSAEEMAHLRDGVARAKGYSPGVAVGPRRGSNGVRVQPVDPASVPRPPARVVPHASEGQSASTSGPGLAPHPSETSGAVTPRSRTVLADRASARADRLGMVFFVAGLGALIGALGYAGWLWSASQPNEVTVQLTSEPPQARILLDGADTGARTPFTLRALNGDRSHSFEFLLDGYQRCTQLLTPTDASEASVACTLQKNP